VLPVEIVPEKPVIDIGSPGIPEVAELKRQFEQLQDARQILLNEVQVTIYGF
jgi:hypothetical protein